MTTYKIAVYPGDGIGVDVTREGLRALEAVQGAVGGFELAYTHFPWGASYGLEHGYVAPPDFLEQLRPFDAIYLGALGDPRLLPDHVTLEPLVKIRQSFDQYACVRPCRLYPGVRNPLNIDPQAVIDFVVLRENSEGEYVTTGGRFKQGQPDEFALQTAIHTRKGIERILRFGFKLAQERRQHLTLVTKSNALKYGMVLWDEILEELQPQYPAIRVDKEHVDAACMKLVRAPQQFDVLVGTNLFGDILSDLGGQIAGGLGLTPSANINPERSAPAMFEPTHGSAPDIIGKGIANPTAAILSAAMMLDWLGEHGAAQRLDRAVERALAQGAATPDLGGHLKTSEMTDRIIAAL
jgi:tartrate dehydrogenase/decarboxylase / D-malate dehydrogenase